MKKLILYVLLILGWAGTVQASDVEFWIPKPGDEVFRVFGIKKGKAFCDLNRDLGHLKGKECKVIAGKEYTLPAGVSLHSKQAAATPVAATPKQEPPCIKLGAHPFNPNFKVDQERTLRGIESLTTLTSGQKEKAKQLIRSGLLPTPTLITRDHKFGEMVYEEKGKLTHVYGKRMCMPEEGGRPEAMYVYDLGDGTAFTLPITCGNPSTISVPVPVSRTPAPPAPPASAPVRPVTPASAPPAVVTPPVVVDKVARDYDWDAGLFAGGDRDVRFAGGDGAGYPLIRYYDWGRYALGGGGGFSLWHGGTPDGYRYSGETAAFGLAQKFSFNNRRDLGIKFPMYGDLWTRGHDKSGSYQQKTHASMLCASASYTDASREKEGKTVAPEWQIWASFCDPFSQKKSHSYNGKALDASTVQDVKYVAGIGGRVFLSKNLGDTGLLAKVQPFAEIGVNQTAPNPISAHAYVGLRTVDKVWGCGVGIHHAETGNLPGATCTYDLGRDVKLHQQKERWDAMVKSLEALGVAID